MQPPTGNEILETQSVAQVSDINQMVCLINGAIAQSEDEIKCSAEELAGQYARKLLVEDPKMPPLDEKNARIHLERLLDAGANFDLDEAAMHTLTLLSYHEDYAP